MGMGGLKVVHFFIDFGDQDPEGGIMNLRHHSAGSPVCQGQPTTVKEIAFLILGWNMNVVELVFHKNFS